jgi:hypothetical protein
MAALGLPEEIAGGLGEHQVLRCASAIATVDGGQGADHDVVVGSPRSRERERARIGRPAPCQAGKPSAP